MIFLMRVCVCASPQPICYIAIRIVESEVGPCSRRLCCLRAACRVCRDDRPRASSSRLPCSSPPCLFLRAWSVSLWANKTFFETLDLRRHWPRLTLLRLSWCSLDAAGSAAPRGITYSLHTDRASEHQYTHRILFRCSFFLLHVGKESS